MFKDSQMPYLKANSISKNTLFYIYMSSLILKISINNLNFKMKACFQYLLSGSRKHVLSCQECVQSTKSRVHQLSWLIQVSASDNQQRFLNY